MKKCDMLYEGKAKKVYATEDPELYIVDYKDDATAFNGLKKGTILGKGAINNRVTNHLMKMLETKGIPTHFVEELSDRETVVKKVHIVPLEVIIRNIAAGSMSKRLGIPEGKVLPVTVLEYSYKNDDLGDPLINDYHALAMELCTREELDQIAQICQEYNLWMHVDGAFGASLLLSPRYRGQLKGIERSDSMSWDAHKWLMQTYGCSMVLLRDRSKLLQSFSTHPEYLRDAETSDDNPNFWDLGPELTRPARGLKLWITLQVVGSEGLGRVIEHGCKMAQLAEKTIMGYPHWEMISHAQQGIINFRYAPPHATEQELDLLNLQIAKEINDTGYAQILTTELNGKRVLRMCILNPQTTEEDIVRTISLLNQTRAVAQRQPSKKVS